MKLRAAEYTVPAVISGFDFVDSEGAGNRIRKALFEARKARHYRDCHCRQFQGRYCNAVDALWQNAVNRELGNLGVNVSSDDTDYDYDDSDDTVTATSTSPDETVVAAAVLHTERPSSSPRSGKRPKRTTPDKYTPFTWR